MLDFLKKVLGSGNDAKLKKLEKTVDAVMALEEAYRGLTDEELQGKTAEFKARLAKGETLDDLLVEAFSLLKTPGIRLLIAGSGRINPPLETLIRSNDRIELINRYIQDEEFQPILERTDFLVLPYRRASQSGVIPMCFAAGKTVVVTDVGALAEQVPQETGILVRPSPADIAQAIDYLYATPGLISQYGKAAHDYAVTHLSWEHSANLLLSHLSASSLS